MIYKIRLLIKIFFNFSFLMELFVFAFTLYLAMGVALNLLSKTVTTQVITTAGDYAALEFLALFFIATIILILIIKYFKRPWVMKGIFYLAIIEGLFYFNYAYFEYPGFLYVTVFLLLLWFMYRNIAMHNVVIMLSISAIAVIFGLNLKPSSAVIILVMLAIYDFWAVYKTKHMIKLFKGMAKSSVHFAIIIPHSFKDLFKKIKDVVPSKEFMFLGTGDIVIPAILVVSVIKYSVLASIYTALGAICGFVLLYLIFITQKQRKAMPGLPPIILGTLAGYFISFLI